MAALLNGDAAAAWNVREELPVVVDIPSMATRLLLMDARIEILSLAASSVTSSFDRTLLSRVSVATPRYCWTVVEDHAVKHLSVFAMTTAAAGSEIADTFADSAATTPEMSDGATIVTVAFA